MSAEAVLEKAKKAETAAETAAGTRPPAAKPALPAAKPSPPKKVPESGGPAGPEPTRYGDWERKGIASDF